VLVIIVNYNSGALLQDAITGVQKQTYRSWKLVVVDNASTDGSADHLEETFPNTQVIRSPKNLGFAAANNLAVTTTPAVSWIALLNPDAVPHPRWLEELVAATRAYPEYGSFSSRTITAHNPDIIDGAGDVYHISGRYWRRGSGSLNSPKYAVNKEVFSACAAAALYSAIAWSKVGGMDETFFCYGEDVDLGFHMQLAGYRCMYIPGALAVHHGSATTVRHSEFSTYHGHRNLVWTFVKNMPGALFWLLLPLHFLLNLGTVGVFMARGQGWVILRAKWDAIKGLPKVWTTRRQIQARRVASVKDIWRVLDKRVIY
jgi:GT2 family glycosyltransferase